MMPMGPTPTNDPKDGATQSQLDALQKYSLDGPFMEPVVRCDACQKLMLTATLKKVGMCDKCGNARVRNIRVLGDEEEIALIKVWILDGKVDPVWFDLFEEEKP